MLEPQYIYKAVIISVYDGDTIRASVDLGFGTSLEGVDRKGLKLRLARIDTPELRGDSIEEGRISKQYVISKVLNKQVTIVTSKDKTGKYGRYIAEVYYKNERGEQVNLNDELVRLKLAVYKEY
jgi:micrococcal nuclease